MKLRNSIFLGIFITISSANLFAELIETPLENGDTLLLELPVDKKVDQAKVVKKFESKV